MFLHLGRNIVVCKSDIIAILDINSTLNSKVNKEFLEMCEEEGFVNEVISGKLRSFIIVGTVKNRNVSGVKVYYSPISALTLQKRANFME